MSDVKQYPPRQRKVTIDCHYKDLASLMMQSVEDKEVLSFIPTDTLEHIIFELQSELQSREESHVVTAPK
jgi:hypothetical protein